jgi:hypothetical protein
VCADHRSAKQIHGLHAFAYAEGSGERALGYSSVAGMTRMADREAIRRLSGVGPISQFSSRFHVLVVVQPHATTADTSNA